MYLTSWTHPLGGSPGPAVIEANLGTAAHRTDMAAELTPAEARAAAWALLERADTAERASEQDAADEGRAARRASGGELLAGILQMRIERWLEQEGVLDIPGFGDVELAGDLDWEPGAGPVYLRRPGDSQVWRAHIAITARPATPEEAKTAVQREQDRTAELRGSWTTETGASTPCRPACAPWPPATRRCSRHWPGSASPPSRVLSQAGDSAAGLAAAPGAVRTARLRRGS